LASADTHTSHLPCGISTVPSTSVVSVTRFISQNKLDHPFMFGLP
jgi:hypothetical protein